MANGLFMELTGDYDVVKARFVLMLANSISEDTFYDAKLLLADVFFAEILPDNVGLAAKVQAGHKHLMQFPEAML